MTEIYKHVDEKVPQKRAFCFSLKQKSGFFVLAAGRKRCSGCLILDSHSLRSNDVYLNNLHNFFWKLNNGNCQISITTMSTNVIRKYSTDFITFRPSLVKITSGWQNTIFSWSLNSLSSILHAWLHSALANKGVALASSIFRALKIPAEIPLNLKSSLGLP